MTDPTAAVLSCLCVWFAHDALRDAVADWHHCPKCRRRAWLPAVFSLMWVGFAVHYLRAMAALEVP